MDLLESEHECDVAGEVLSHIQAAWRLECPSTIESAFQSVEIDAYCHC